jgi:hypothetical protein
VKIYVRADARDSIDQVRNMGFTPLLIAGLHTKLYLNEHSAIVSSMNLLESSDRNSLDIAVKTENEREYAQLSHYYATYIEPVGRAAAISLYTDWREMLDRRIKDAVGVAPSIEPTGESLVINGWNKYEAFIHNERGNDLRISGILTGREYAAASRETQLFSKTAMNIELVPAQEGRYNTVWGTHAGLKSQHIHALRKEEEPIIAESIVRFICAVELFKKMVG